MKDAEFCVRLSELLKVSVTLNQESGEMNILIQQFQDKLRALNIGFEVWTEGRADDESGAHIKPLGFKKLGDAWMLCVRYPEVPLVQAPRAVRIASLQRFPELLKALKVRAEKALESIREAKAFVGVW